MHPKNHIQWQNYFEKTSYKSSDLWKKLEIAALKTQVIQVSKDTQNSFDNVNRK